MTKTRIRKFIGATALTGAVVLGSATGAFASSEEDDGDDDDSGGADPTAVNTGGVFDDSDNLVPLAITATGLMVVAGGAFAVRRRALVRRASTVVMALSLAGALAIGVLAFSKASSAEQPVLWVTPQTTTPSASATTTSSTVASPVPDTGLPVIATPSDEPEPDAPEPATDSAADPDGAATSEPQTSGSTAPDSAAVSTSTTTAPTTTLPPLRLPKYVSSTHSTFGGFPIVPVGTEENGELEVPGAREIGWYERGGAPGRPGATVLAAHVSWNGDLGPFWNLGDAQIGDEVEVVLEDGSVRVYVVTEVAMYDKYDLPGDRIWRRSGPETLVLITCGGEFDDSINRFKHNIVVYAEPVA